VILSADHGWHDRPDSPVNAALVAAPLSGMSQPQASVDGPALLVGVMGTVGTVTALTQGEWLWAAIISSGSIVAELLVVLARRRRARRAQNP
jgi:hypothetical protein